MATVEPLNERVMIPDLLRAAPHARAVLDRYGLRGCGGPMGPVESLAFFARAHDIPIDRLLQELREAVDQPAARPPAGECDATATAGDTIYRPFFKAGIAVGLTLGAAWGAYLLLRIGFGQSFRAVGLHEVNAHGHAQIFGWVGLFVMGFAYQAFPRFKHTSLALPRVAYASLWLMLLGLLGRSIGEPLAASVAWLGPVAIAAGVLEVIAIALFIFVIATTWRVAGKGLAFYEYYIASALGWFFVQAVYEVIYLAATLQTADRARLLDLVATWQAPLREIQIHGFAMLMILGVSQRIFHYFYELPAPNSRISRVALVGLNAAVCGEVAGLILMRTAGHAWAGLWYSSVVLLTVLAGVLVGSWRIFAQPGESDRSLKFLRTAYVWLFISLAMLVALPAYQFGLLAWLVPESAAAQMGFSHAYYGAVRHAITVGFISLMIVGVSAKVVPTLNGVDVHALTPLWGPYLLINAGCSLRVGGQTLSDFVTAAFPFSGVSGLLEVAGLALWGVHLWSIMAGRAVLRTAHAAAYAPVMTGEPILPAHRVGDILDHYPELLDTFLGFGFKPLANPLLRKTLARHITVEQACRRMDVDLPQLLCALNERRQQMVIAV